MARLVLYSMNFQVVGQAAMAIAADHAFNKFHEQDTKNTFKTTFLVLSNVWYKICTRAWSPFPSIKASNTLQVVGHAAMAVVADQVFNWVHTNSKP